MNNEITSIDWDNESSIIDLFNNNITSKEEEKESTENVKKDEEVENKEEEIVESDLEVFDKKEENSNEEEEDIDNKEIINLLKEKGYIEDDEEIDETIDPLMYVVEKEVEEKLKDLLSDVPPIIKELVEYHTKGGDVYEYLNKAVSGQLSISMLNPENEKDQEKIIRIKLQKEGYDEEDIEQQIEVYKDLGKLGLFAKKFHKKLLEEEELKKQKIIEEARKREELAREQARKFREEIKNFIKTNKKIMNIPIDVRDIKELPDYMTNRSVKLDNGALITKMQYDLMVAMQDKKKAIVLAKLLKNDFDISKFLKSIETKVTRKIKNKLQNKEGENSEKKVLSIADFIK